MVDSSILIILSVLFLSNTIYGLASPFLPQLLEDKGIEPIWTGLIFSSYSITMVILSPVVGATVDRVGHRWMIVVGVILMSASISSFGLVKYVTTNPVIIAASIVLRVFQGK